MRTILFFVLLFPQYVLAQAKSAKEVNPLAVGQEVPKGTLLTTDAKSVEFAKVLDGKPAVVIFFRGGWCPYCTLHLAELQKIESKLKERGYKIVAISADHYHKTQNNIDKNKLTYELYSDPNLDLATAFGVSYKVDNKTYEGYKNFGIDLEEESGESHHLLPVPAAFVVDKGGVIRFSFANADYKVRVKADKLLAEAKKLT